MNYVESTSRCSKSATALRCRASSQTRALVRLACGLSLFLSWGLAQSETLRCQQEDTANPHLQVNTTAGMIDIRLYPEAAPSAVAMLSAMVTEPIAREAGTEALRNSNYYDGLSIDYTKPHIEIRTSKRRSPDVVFNQEIDAEALGLHEQRISTAGQAMNAIQDELLPKFRAAQRSGTTLPQLERWLEKWYDGYEADFLIGVSRQQINEALGHRYIQGLASKPVRKGSVALKPASTSSASPILSIALKDMPQRTGKWMVVGEVVQGLNLADRISTAPLDRPTYVRSRTYKPRDPVVIESVRMECG